MVSEAHVEKGFRDVRSGVGEATEAPIGEEVSQTRAVEEGVQGCGLVAVVGLEVGVVVPT